MPPKRSSTKKLQFVRMLILFGILVDLFLSMLALPWQQRSVTTTAAPLLAFLPRVNQPTTEPSSIPTDTLTDTGNSTSFSDALNDTVARTPPQRHYACTSPEYSVPWPFQGDATSYLSNLTCGLSSSNNHDASSPLSRYLKEEIIPLLEQPFSEECQRLVVYSVAFGTKYMENNNNTDDRFEYHKHHGRCFFMFVLQEDHPLSLSSAATTTRTNSRLDENSLTMVGHFWLIPIPRHVLPYQNMRRNTKLIKFAGHDIFPFCQERIVWQDAKFVYNFWRRTPVNYGRAISVFDTGQARDEPCVRTMGLPRHRNAFGDGAAKDPYYRPHYMHHCNAIVKALNKRPNVTDLAAEAIANLCQKYANEVPRTGIAQEALLDQTLPLTLDLGLVDSAFMVWNVARPQCRAWNAELQCSILDELHCHADRDQLSIPYVFHRMGLQFKVDEVMEWRGHVYTPDQHLQLVLPSNTDKNDSTTSNHPMVFITKSDCHWYYVRVSNCKRPPKPLELQSKPTTQSEDVRPKKVPTLAILVTGTTNRYLLNSTVEHVLGPLTHGDKPYKADYFALLTETRSKAYRQDLEYMNHVVGDPLFHEKNLSIVAREVIGESGATLQALMVLQDAIPLDRKQLGGKEEFDVRRFPIFDSRDRRRTAAGNRNMITLFNNQQHLWDARLRKVEESNGEYDYIMIIRDDAFWLEDFDLTKLLESNPDADAYVQACEKDRRYPIRPTELNDHGIVIRRQKAAVVGRYLSSMISTDREACDFNSGLLPKRGCNSEMLLSWILNDHGITVERVPQSLLPFERSVAIRGKDGSIKHCFHKFCQSYAAPLEIPESMHRCVELDF